MSNADIREELLQLRKEVAALAAARKQHKSKSEHDDEEAATTAEHAETDSAIKKQIEELIKLLQDEIRDMPVAPTLTVLLLGILIGRYLR